jgi:hypothetical protein
MPYRTHLAIAETIDTGFETDTHRHVHRLGIQRALSPS